VTRGLDGIPTADRSFFVVEQNAASYMRAMVIAAELGHALGNRDAARRWASAVVTLWRNADAELQPTVERLRKIAATPGDF
jgi:hypothetical protein